MSLRRSLPRIDEWDVRVLATDIDTNMIAACQAGRYETAKSASIPADLARKFVRPVADGLVEMDEKLKQMIRFNTLNLLANWPMLGPFDVIFCRNVVIYFDKDTQRTLFDRFAEMLRPKGWLFIGHSES